ncbi:MAG: hypothetical protein MK098_08940 [Marinovum sp.]|nr:hypothetical protein [Marinovum sp.]
MSICRSKLGGLLAVWALAGCTPELSQLGFAPLGATPPASARALSEADLAAGDIRLKTPAGWCIEPRSLRNSGRSSFALVGDCNALLRNSGGVHAGYVTVTVGPAQLSPSSGETLLSAASGSSNISPTVLDNGVARAPVDGEENDGFGPQWRAAQWLARHPVLVTVYSSEEDILSAAPGARLLDQVLHGLIAQREPNLVSTDPSPETQQTLDVGNLLGRLFNGNDTP